MKAKLKIKQIRSCIGVNYRMVENLKGLGLGRIGRTVVVRRQSVALDDYRIGGP